MKKVLKYWPIIVLLISMIWCYIDFNNQSYVGDALGLGLLFYYILYPLLALIISSWYAFKIKSNYKWLLIVFFGLFEFFMLGLPYQNWALSDLELTPLTIIPSFIGIIIGDLLKKRKNTRSKKKKKKYFKYVIGIILLIFIIVGSVTAYCLISYNYLKSIERKPVYTEELPPLIDAIDTYELPLGYVTDNQGAEESFERIYRENDLDNPVININLEDYKGKNQIGLNDIIKYSIYAGSSSDKEIDKWLNEANKSEHGNNTVYINGKEAIVFKDGTFILCSIFSDYSKITKKDKEAFEELVNSIVIK